MSETIDPNTGSHNTEANRIAFVARIALSPASAAHIEIIDDPRAATLHPASLAIHILSPIVMLIRVRIEQTPCPLPHTSRHIETTENA